MTSSVRKLSSRISNYIKPLPVQTNGLTQTGVILVYFKELFIGNPAGRVSTIYNLIESHFAVCFNLVSKTSFSFEDFAGTTVRNSSCGLQELPWRFPGCNLRGTAPTFPPLKWLEGATETAKSQRLFSNLR